MFGDEIAETIEEAGEKVHKERRSSFQVEERKMSEVAEHNEIGVKL